MLLSQHLLSKVYLSYYFTNFPRISFFLSFGRNVKQQQPDPGNTHHALAKICVLKAFNLVVIVCDPLDATANALNHPAEAAASVTKVSAQQPAANTRRAEAAAAHTPPKPMTAEQILKEEKRVRERDKVGSTR